jgi:hypothetical protein
LCRFFATRSASAPHPVPAQVCSAGVMLPDAERNVKAFEATKITHCCHCQFAKILKSLYSQAKADIKLTGIHNSNTIEIDFNTGVRILTRYMSPNPSLLLMAVKKHLQQYEAANAIAKDGLIRGQNIGVLTNAFVTTMCTQAGANG